MGREVRRVPLDFDWPVGKRWKGFLNPYEKYQRDCFDCGATGHNPETRKIADDWYDFKDLGTKWCHNITQHEVDALIEANRLMDFTHTWSRENGWEKIEPAPFINAHMVNEWSKTGIGHDALNRHICVRARAEQRGVYGKCPICHGEGVVWDSPRMKERYESWEQEDPPKGEGWQLWETVSEGSPITPVYPTAEKLIKHMCRRNAPGALPWDTGYSEEAARSFVMGPCWAPSMAIIGGKLMSGVEAFVGKDEEDEQTISDE